MKKVSNLLISIFSVLLILLIWCIISFVTDAQLIFPSISSVILKAFEIIKNLENLKYFLHTFIRINISLFITIITGTLLGIASGCNSTVNQFFKIPISIIRSTPVIAVILMALFWYKSTQVPVFVSVLMTVPVMITSVSKGFEENKQAHVVELLNMAKVYNLSTFQIFYKIKWPHAFPFFISGVQSVTGMTWKVVCAGEVLSLPKYSLGYLMHSAQIHLESAELIAYTVILVVSSFIYERILIFILNSIAERKSVI